MAIDRGDELRCSGVDVRIDVDMLVDVDINTWAAMVTVLVFTSLSPL